MRFSISIFIFFLTLTISGRTDSRDSLKAEANDAFYQIFNTYRSHDCDSIYNMFADSLLVINSPVDTVLYARDILDKEVLCRKTSRIDTSITDSIHKKYYRVLAFSAEDLTGLTKESIDSLGFVYNLGDDARFYIAFIAYKVHRMSSNDILVIGTEPKRLEDFYDMDGEHYNEKKDLPYKLERPGYYILLLRKTEQGWKIRGCSS